VTGAHSRRAAFEAEAEVLAAHQLDLLSQLEAQLRAVHHTMRCIEKLRGAKHRVGPDVTNGQRADALNTLAAELAAIDKELNVQHQSCEDMQRSIREMQAQLSALRRTLETQTKQ
jgi:predicted  nucleic acid-binding Zn-ribbon protein